jgi:signal peptidase I
MPQPASTQPRPGWLQVLLIGRRPKRTLLRAGIIIVVCFVVFHFLLLPARVQGISMLPTYHTGQFNCVNRLAYLRHEPRRGDVVSVRFADPGGLAGPHVLLMKRVVGLPGETVTFHDGRACINGTPLDEPYVKYPCNWEEWPIVCGPSQYYVVGDNRSMPFALHEQGRAERKRIVGKMLL